jgi:glutamate carboxypeptidase
MDLLQLPVDIDEALAGLRPWVECESPTWDAAAVNRMLSLACRDFAIAGARIERIPGRMGFGDCARITFPHPRAGEAGILMMGYMDTVHPIGTLEKLPWRKDGGRCYGPGILDMKGGIYSALEGLRQLARAAVTTVLPVTVLLTSDEEVGSPSTRDLIEAEGSRHKYVLVPEFARADGGVVTGRYAIARFNLEAAGRPSHAGVRLSDGRSAIREMARKILEVEQMTTEDCTFSVGVVRGGQWVNCVSSSCRGEVLSMAKRQGDLDRGVAAMLALSSTAPDISFVVTRGVTRPVWEPDSRTMDLYDRARSLAQSMGLDLAHHSAGGGSDANFTGALGIPTLDALGLRGEGYHTLNEHIEIESIAERTRLMAGLFATLE